MPAAYIILQRRSSVAANQIRRSFNKLNKVLSEGDDLLSVASFNSTTTSERLRNHLASPASHFKAYLMREDFASDFHGANAAFKVKVMNSIESSTELFKETPYVYRPLGKANTM